MIPSGFVHTDARLLIGAGVLVDPEVFHYELNYLNKYHGPKSYGYNNNKDGHSSYTSLQLAVEVHGDLKKMVSSYKLVNGKIDLHIL